jgi:hypothetical protein
MKIAEVIVRELGHKIPDRNRKHNQLVHVALEGNRRALDLA